VDLFDIFSSLPIHPGGSASRRRAPNEELAAGIVLIVLPAIDLCVVLFTRLAASHPTLAIIYLPLGFAALGYLVARTLQAPVGYSLLLTLGCAFWCLFAGFCAVVLALFTWSF
jgi:hypothetical protein